MTTPTESEWPAAIAAITANLRTWPACSDAALRDGGVFSCEMHARDIGPFRCEIDTAGTVRTFDASGVQSPAAFAWLIEGIRLNNERDGCLDIAALSEWASVAASPEDESVPATLGGGDERPRRVTVADRLIALVPDDMLFVGLYEEGERADVDAGRVFVTFYDQGVRESWPLRSKRVRRRLMRSYQQETGAAANAEALKQALDTIEGRGFDRTIPREIVHRRTARIGDVIWIDIGDDSWRVLRVTRDGWEIVTTPPVRFHRPEGMQALPDPVHPRSVSNGDLLEPPEEAMRRGRLAALAPLRAILNLREGEDGEGDFVLAIGWLLMALGGQGAYPLLVLLGEQGTAKSTFMRILRALCDPHAAGIRPPPRDDDTLRVAVANSFVLAFDNLSSMPLWLSDALCRISTGIAEGRRQHYSDLDEIIVKAHAPVMLNGIVEFVTRPDLANRAVFIHLETIAPEERMRDVHLEERIAAALPSAMGALLDGLSEGLRRENRAPLALLPRMADFAQFASDCETAYWPAGTFMASYRGSLDASIGALLDTTAVTAVLMRWAPRCAERRWRGTMSELLELLTRAAWDRERHLKSWPQTAHHLSGVIARFAPALRSRGFRLAQGRSDGSRWVEIEAPAAPPDDRPIAQGAGASGAAGPEDQPGDPGWGIGDADLHS